MLLESILIVAAVAAGVSLAMSAVLWRLGARFKLYPAIRARDVHKAPTPRLGGIAMYLGLVAGLGVAYQLPTLHKLVFEQNNTQLIAIFCAATLIVFVGVLDDFFDLHWSTKLLSQVSAAALLALWGNLQLTQLPIGSLGVLVNSRATSLALTLLVVLVVINMINFIDGLDGLVAGIAIIANSTYFIYNALILQAGGPSRTLILGLLLSAVMCAVCVGFLPLNWHPAKLFMGDSGSMLVGLMFAVTAISVTGGIEPTQFFAINTTGNYTRASFAPAFLPLLLPVVILIVPVLDFTLAILRRLSAGKSPFTADRKHLHHRLLDMGHSHLHATLIFYALTAVISAGSLLFYLVSPPIVAWSVIAGGLLVCAVATLLPLSSRKRGEQSTQTRPIQILTPTSAALDPLDKAAAESNPSVK